MIISDTHDAFKELKSKKVCSVEQGHELEFGKKFEFFLNCLISSSENLNS